MPPLEIKSGDSSENSPGTSSTSSSEFSKTSNDSSILSLALTASFDSKGLCPDPHPTINPEKIRRQKRRRAFSIRFTGDDATYIKRKGEMSPPFPNVKLKKGKPLDSKTFPVLISS